MSPLSCTVGSPAQQLTLKGLNFTSHSIVQADGKTLLTSFVDAQTLRAILPPSKLINPGAIGLSIFDADTGNSSGAVPFSVNPVVPGPQITALYPSSVREGAPAQTLAIAGSGFLPTSTVVFNGRAHLVVYSSENQLSISIASAELQNPGSYKVVVTNPTANGPLSYAAKFEVLDGATPVLGSAMFRMNPQRTNTTAAAGPTQTPSFLPIVTLKNGSTLRRIGSDGTVIVTGPDGDPCSECRWVTAYKPDGSLKWQVPYQMNSDGDFSDVAIAPNGVVYLLTQIGGGIVALDGSTGRALWQDWTNPAGSESGNIADGRGTIYFQTDDLTATLPSGSLKWSNPAVSARSYRYSVFDAQDARIYLPGDSGPPSHLAEADSYSSATGSLQDQNSNCAVPSFAAVSAKQVIAVSTSNHLYTLPIDLSQCTDLNQGNPNQVVDSLEAVTNDNVLVTSLGGVLSGYNLSGQNLWTGSGQLGGGFADLNGTLFEVVLTPGSNSNQIEALDSRTGKTLWTYAFPDFVYNSPTPNQILMGPDGSLYVTAGHILYRALPGRTSQGTPDLVPTSLSVDMDTIDPGMTVNAKFTIANQGTATAITSQTGFRLGTSQSVPPGPGAAIPDSIIATPPLVAGQSVNQTATVTIPAGTPAGAYYIWVVVDDTPNSAVGQRNTNNDYLASSAINVNGDAPPSVSTLPVSGVSTSGFTMSGVFNPNGSPALAWFNWWLNSTPENVGPDTTGWFLNGTSPSKLVSINGIRLQDGDILSVQACAARYTGDYDLWNFQFKPSVCGDVETATVP